MIYLKCVWIFFLVYSLIECMVGTINIKNSNMNHIEKLLTYFLAWIIGGFWLFLLFKLI